MKDGHMSDGQMEGQIKRKKQGWMSYKGSQMDEHVTDG